MIKKRQKNKSVMHKECVSSFVAPQGETLLKECAEIKKTGGFRSKVIGVIVNILVTVITSTIFQFHANQLQNTANIIAQRNQQPSFQIESVYQNDHLSGYSLIISGGQVEHMSIQLERFVHFDTKGFLTSDECYIPYNEITMYCAEPSDTVFLDLYPKDTLRGGLVSPLDASNFINEVGSTLRDKHKTYMFQILDILTLDYTDYSRIRRTEKYVLYSFSSDDPHDSSKNQDQYYLYPLDEAMINRIESMIPQIFDRSYGDDDIRNFILPNELYSYVESNDYFSSRGFGYSRDNILIKATFEFFASLGFEP